MALFFYFAALWLGNLSNRYHLEIIKYKQEITRFVLENFANKTL